MGKKSVRTSIQNILLCYRRIIFCGKLSRLFFHWPICLLTLFTYSSLSYASLPVFLQNQLTVASVTSSISNSLDKDQIEFIKGNDKTNIIPFFDNRFRIDANLDEITMVFYRDKGSKPVILIKPDGSKIRVIDYDKESVSWYDDSHFDMIKIKNPMPGPWQAVGDIKEDSKIFIVSDVKIVAVPLPKLIFKGETLKVTSTLLNGNNAIDVADFRKVVILDVHFLSENNKEDQNFGTEAIKVASFKDDGRLLDERLGDGIFTGEFALDLAPGMWKPTYLVKLPLASRTLQQTSVKVIPPPIQFNVTVSHSEDVDHKLTIKLLSDLVDVESIIIEGKIIFPDRQIERFSITEGRGSYRHKTIEFTESGIYKIDANVFGKTLDGRDFRLKLTQHTFNVDSKILRENKVNSNSAYSKDMKQLQDVTDEARVLLQGLTEEEQIIKEKLLANRDKNEESQPNHVIFMAIIANTAIISFGVILFVLYRRKKARNT
ncbi:MAG: TIGR03503 family protein [Colwellia sp.]